MLSLASLALTLSQSSALWASLCVKVQWKRLHRQILQENCWFNFLLTLKMESCWEIFWIVVFILWILSLLKFRLELMIWTLMHCVLNYEKGQKVINYWRSSLTNLHYSKVLFHFLLFLFFYCVFALFASRACSLLSVCISFFLTITWHEQVKAAISASPRWTTN